MADPIRAALAAPTPEQDTNAVLRLAAVIRQVDSSHSLGAAALAEAILSHPAAREVLAATTPPVDGETEKLATRLVADAECLEADQPDLMSLDNHHLRRAAARAEVARQQGE